MKAAVRAASGPEPFVMPDVATREGAFEFVLGIVLNQAQRAEHAWRAAFTLGERLGTRDPIRWSQLPDDAIAKAMQVPSALHRFPKVMAEYVNVVTRHIVDHYQGDARELWRPPVSGSELLTRLLAIRGIGRHKAEVAIFLLTVAYQLEVIDDGILISIRACPRLVDMFGGITDACLVKLGRKRRL